MKDKDPLIVPISPMSSYMKLFNILDHSSKQVLFGLRLIESVDEIIPTTQLKPQGSLLSVRIENNLPVKEQAEEKLDFRMWIFQKGFEDMIKGVNLCLLEAFFYLSILSKKTEISTYGLLNDEISKVKALGSKKHLPDLIKRVTYFLNENLNFEEEVLSLNKVRNCFVHRNGIVTEQDINDKEKMCLIVKYARLKICLIEKGKEIELTEGVTTNGGDVYIKYVSESISFNIGEKILLNNQRYNELILAVFLFGEDLVKKMGNFARSR